MIKGLTRRLSLQSKILIALLSISLSAVLWMTTLTNRYYTDAVTQEFQTIASEAAQRLDHHLEYYFQQLVKSTHVLSADPVVQMWFLGEESLTDSQSSQLQEVLGKYVLTGNPEVLQVYLVSNDGRIITTTPTVS